MLILLSIALKAQAQSRYSVFLNAGYSYNETFKLNDEEVKNSIGYVFYMGLAYKVIRYKKMYSEIGLAGKTIFSSGEIAGSFYSARTLRLAMPLKFAFPVSDKWEIFSGFVFQNNVDVSEFDIRLRDKYSWRVDYSLEAKYLLNNRWYLTAGFSLNMRKIPDSYFVNDPRNAILIGLNRRITILKSKKNKL